MMIRFSRGIRTGFFLLCGLIILISNRKSQTKKSFGEILRYESWSNYMATINREAIARRNNTLHSSAFGQETRLDPKKMPRVLCFQKQSGFSDKMFEFASGYGIAKSTNQNLFVEKSILPMFTLKTDGTVFHRTNIDMVCLNSSRHRPIEISQSKTKEPETARDSVTVLKRSFNSWKHFRNVETELRQLFTFQENITAKAAEVLREIRERHFRKRHISQTFTLVGIYVQRNTVTNPFKRLIVPPRSYFLKAMMFYKRRFPNVIFVLVTDSIDWCRKNLPSFIYIINKDPPNSLDMSVLSQCNHTINSIGTFGWWSAWLANGVTTYFEPVIINDLWLKTVIKKTYEDYFLPEWTPIHLLPYESKEAHPLPTIKKPKY